MRNMLEMVGCSRLPGSHGLVAWKTSDNSDTVQTRASHTSHMHSFTGGHLGVIHSKRALLEQFEFDAV